MEKCKQRIFQNNVLDRFSGQPIDSKPTLFSSEIKQIFLTRLGEEVYRKNSSKISESELKPDTLPTDFTYPRGYPPIPGIHFFNSLQNHGTNICLIQSF